MTAPPFDCRGVFFDLYGTLLTYGAMDRAWADWLAGMHEGLGREGHDVAPERLEATFTRFLNRPEPPVGTPGRTLFERRVAHELAGIGVALPDAALAEVCTHAIARWQAHVALDPDAHAVLETVRAALPTALVSNFDHEIHVHDVLRATRLAELFDAIVVSAEVGYAKPDPRVFDAALRATGLDPADVVYVGDDDVDRDAAHAAGMRFVRIDRRGTPRDDGVPTIAGLTSLPALLRPVADRRA